MKNLFLSYGVIILTVFLAIRANGQTVQPPFQISGTIVDSTTQDPLPYVAVTLKNSNNNPIENTLTKNDGSFTFSRLEPLLYHLTITSLAYNNKTITVDLTDTTIQGGNLGTIYITEEVKILKEVKVVADKLLIRREADRITYDVQADPDNRSSNVLEIMRKVPFLSLDANGNILLKNNSSYRIFLNGKPSGMLTSSPKEILRNMPASTVKRIEVITTPPSKYDAEGLAGIINIILIKKKNNGVEGTINANGRFPKGGPGIGGSISMKQEKFGVTAYGGAGINNMPATEIYKKRNSFFSTNPTMLIQNGSNKSDTRTGHFGIELSYEIDSLNLISASFNGYGNTTNGSNNLNSILTNEDQLLEGYSFANENKNTGKGIDAGVNYQIGFESDKNRLLTFSYNYRTHSNGQVNNMMIDNRVNYNIPEYRQFNDGNASEQTGQIDYVHPVKNLTIEAGIKGIFRVNKSDYQYYSRDSVTKNFEIDSTFSNNFKNHQNVFGIYNSYNYTLNNWTIKAGVRIEQTVTDVDFLSTETKVHQNYFHIIPTIAVNYKLNDNSSLNFGFTRRLKRPGIHKLNPYVDRSNPNFESTGNPNLRPSITSMFQLGYGKSGKLDINIGTGYVFFNNLDLRVSEFDPARNITRSTFKNIGSGSAFTGDININYPVTKCLKASLNSNLTYLRAEGVNDGALMKVNNLLSNINLSNSYKFGKEWRINANVRAVGPNIVSLQTRSNSIFSTSFAVSKELLQGKLSVSATVNNPFTKYRNNRIETTGASFLETSVTREYFRIYGFNLNLKLGELKEDIKKNKRGVNSDDISNSKDGL